MLKTLLCCPKSISTESFVLNNFPLPTISMYSTLMSLTGVPLTVCENEKSVVDSDRIKSSDFIGNNLGVSIYIKVINY